MAQRTSFSDPPPDDDGEFEDEYLHPDDIEYDPDSEDLDREFTWGDSPEQPCPHCGATITEDHQRCPACELFITKEDESAQPSSQTPFVKWMVIATLAMIVLVWLLQMM
jgi:predicted nucleic acid-binding Zn ribbon protein